MMLLQRLHGGRYSHEDGWSFAWCAGYAKLVIPGAAHMVSMEKPEEFNAAVLEFLGGM